MSSKHGSSYHSHAILVMRGRATSTSAGVKSGASFSAATFSDAAFSVAALSAAFHSDAAAQLRGASFLAAAMDSRFALDDMFSFFDARSAGTSSVASASLSRSEKICGFTETRMPSCTWAVCHFFCSPWRLARVRELTQVLKSS